MQSATTAIPAEIISAAANLLKPYGVDLQRLLAPPTGERELMLQPLEKKWFTTREATHYSGLSRHTLWRAAKEGLITVKKLSDTQQGRTVYERASLDAWLQGSSLEVVK